MAEKTFELRTGMDVVDKDGNTVGPLDRILSEDATGDSRFITVKNRLLPVEALQGVEGDRIKLSVESGKLHEFPTQDAMDMPGRDAQQKAYQAIGLTGPRRD